MPHIHISTLKIQETFSFRRTCWLSRNRQSKQFHIARNSEKNFFEHQDIQLLPKADFSQPRKTARIKGKTSILTDIPEKKLLEAIVFTTNGAKKKATTKYIVKTVKQISSSEEENNNRFFAVKTTKKVKRIGDSAQVESSVRE